MPLKVSDGIGAWIKDFKKSDAPQFKGKSAEERRDQAIAAYLSAKRGDKKEEAAPKIDPQKYAAHMARNKKPKKMSSTQKSLSSISNRANKMAMEDFMFKVGVEGLPDMIIGGSSPGEVKARLRKIVKQPSMITSVSRMTPAEVKKRYRDMAQGKDVDEVDEAYKEPQGQAKRMMSPLQKMRMDKEKKDRDRKGRLKAGIGAMKKAGNAKAKAELGEGSESWAAGYKRRVVKTSKPEHKAKGYNWRIKGKDRPEISIKLYKEKPSQAEFNKQMRRVAGHEFGG